MKTVSLLILLSSISFSNACDIVYKDEIDSLENLVRRIKPTLVREFRDHREGESRPFESYSVDQIVNLFKSFKKYQHSTNFLDENGDWIINELRREFNKKDTMLQRVIIENQRREEEARLSSRERLNYLCRL
ncbi:hypothetical protein A3F66_02755 [candidate division TM6 bacterium RIFCSPHIGHO2_12_FULL_32_22]|nr:MAG: hypothetical protein A3F66_02755 [candidate division TM6 bacterium RIFCSPHIGHO2_12_FULL_32_22]